MERKELNIIKKIKYKITIHDDFDINHYKLDLNKINEKLVRIRNPINEINKINWMETLRMLTNKLNHKIFSVRSTVGKDNQDWITGFPMTSKSRSNELNYLSDNISFKVKGYNNDIKEQYFNTNSINFKKDNGIIIENLSNQIEKKSSYLELIKSTKSEWYPHVEKHIYNFHTCIDNARNMNISNEHCQTYLIWAKELFQIYLNTKGL